MTQQVTRTAIDPQDQRFRPGAADQVRRDPYRRTPWIDDRGDRSGVEDRTSPYVSEEGAQLPPFFFSRDTVDTGFSE